jgi:hypothetical protein
MNPVEYFTEVRTEPPLRAVRAAPMRARADANHTLNHTQGQPQARFEGAFQRAGRGRRGVAWPVARRGVSPHSAS